MAWQQQNGATQTMAWEHRDASNATVKMPGALRGSSAELDPMGSDAGVVAPPPSPPDEPLRELAYPGFASAVSSECRIDGMDMPCGLQQRLMEVGALRQKHPTLPIDNAKSGRKRPETDITPIGGECL